MAEWIEPIYDRTPADVTHAQLQVQEWIRAISQGETVTIRDLKGFLNVSDLNRIEKDTEYLSYSSTHDFSIKTDWERNDLPKINDIERIINNIKKLINEFELKEFTYEMPETLLTYNHVNVIEHNLRIIKTLIEDVENQIKSEFSIVVLELESKISLPLITQIKADSTNVNFESNIALSDAYVISIYSLFGLSVTELSSKIIDCFVLPIKSNFEGIAYQNIKVADLKSLSVREKFNPFIGTMGCSIIPSNSNSMKSSLNLYSLFIKCEFLSSTSTLIESNTLPSVTNMLIKIDLPKGLEVVPSSQIFNEESKLSAHFGFADTLISSSFERVELNVKTKIKGLSSNAIKLNTDTIVKANTKITLYGHSRLSDYKTDVLSLMDIKTLKELSYTEI